MATHTLFLIVEIMTGTGNPVLRIRGNDRYSGREYYYVMGKAMDDKIDMSIQQSPGYAASGPVLVNTDGDKLQDILYQVNNQGGDSLQRYAGSLWVVHGSTQIPVHLNPKYAVKRQTSPISGLISIYPNPAHLETAVSFAVETAGAYSITIHDLLGRVMYRSTRRCDEGDGVWSLQTELFPQGTYYVTIEGAGMQKFGKILVARTGIEPVYPP